MPEEIEDYSFLLSEAYLPKGVKTVNVVPDEDIIEHDTDSTCPCQPKLNYRCPDTQREIWVHNCLKENPN